MNWSGGKDSALCLSRVMNTGMYHVRALLTSVNAANDRISMHGVRRNLLEVQAKSIGIPLQTIELPDQPDMEEYETQMMQAVKNLKNSGCTHAIFGDIFLEDLKAYRISKLEPLGIKCVFPLWKNNTTDLMKEFISSGFKSVIVCVHEKFLDKSYCGRLIDESFLSDLPDRVDPCGENGEFHSFVYDGPIFSYPIQIKKGEIVFRKYRAPSGQSEDHLKEKPEEYGFYFCDIMQAP
ncbi:MAG: ATP-binding protein [Bacteroidetes bacterium]|nr:MAG: ATP-binding protein [Bacteroidota bacterium]